ncbi:MAG: hypothetical protein JWL84_3487 [Rhodospirillales bacterium]|nr:hypothetical protein [Rhodospirillales bacterium]
MVSPFVAVRLRRSIVLAQGRGQDSTTRHTPPHQVCSLSSSKKDALIRAPLPRVDALIAGNAVSREWLNLPQGLGPRIVSREVV